MILIEVRHSAGQWRERSERSCRLVAQLEAASLARSLGVSNVRVREFYPHLPILDEAAESKPTRGPA